MQDDGEHQSLGYSISLTMTTTMRTMTMTMTSHKSLVCSKSLFFLTLKVRREDAERIFKRWGDMVVKGQVIKTKTL